MVACSRFWYVSWLCSDVKSGRAPSTISAPASRHAPAIASTRALVSALTGHMASSSQTAIRSPSSPSSARVGNLRVYPRAMMSSGPAIVRTAVSRSTADRPSGPMTEMSEVARTSPGGACPRIHSRFHVGLWPKTPQKCAGLRIEPPMSEPASRPVSPAASAAADPPDEPPGARV